MYEELHALLASKLLVKQGKCLIPGLACGKRDSFDCLDAVITRTFVLLKQVLTFVLVKQVPLYYYSK